MEIVGCRLIWISLLVHIKIVWSLIRWERTRYSLRCRWHVLVNVTWWLLHLLIYRLHHWLLVQLSLLLWWKHILIIIVDRIRPIGGHMVILYLHFIQVFIYLPRYKMLDHGKSITYGLKLCLTRAFPSGVANLFASLSKSSSFFPYVLSPSFRRAFLRLLILLFRNFRRNFTTASVFPVGLLPYYCLASWSY